MFKQLTYFQYLQEDVRGLQERAKQLNGRLADAYSPPERVYCSLRNQIDAILLEEEQLSSLLSVILQQVTNDTLVPSQVDSLLLSQLAPHSLPEWFPHVLEKEYGRAKLELDAYTRSLAAMHELQQKRKAMREERENLETLYRRTIVISATQKNEHFTDIDIMQDVEHLRNRIKHVKKTFQYFCNQVAGKIKEFIEQLIDKSVAFNRPQSPPSLHRSGKMASDIFRQSDNMAKLRSYNDLPEESFKVYNQARSISPRSQLTTAKQNQPRMQPSKDRFQDYYGRSMEWKAGENLSPAVKYTQPHHHAGLKYELRSSCINHEDHSTVHRHTCEKGRDWLRAAKSQQRFKLSSSETGSKYNYRRYMPNSTSEYY